MMLLSDVNLSHVLPGPFEPLWPVPDPPPLNPTAEQTDEPDEPPPLPSPCKSAKILIVDDEPLNIRVARKFLSTAGYANVIETTNPVQASILARQTQPDVVLLDVVMPKLNGIDVLWQLRNDPQTSDIPIIVLTAAENAEAKLKALTNGATDYLTKPVEPAELALRVRNALLLKAHFDHLKHHAEKLEQQVRQRTFELSISRLELIHCLARAAEFRDNETQRHALRVGRYAGIVAHELALPAETCELIEWAAPLHDIGKIGVPDEILARLGRMEPEEMALLQTPLNSEPALSDATSPNGVQDYRLHTRLGERILHESRSPLLEMAGRIALTHHEKWDGSGYPQGLAGEAIPLEGRITAVVDRFDALSSKRPGRPGFPIEKCFSILEGGRGRQFDPCVLDAFFARRQEIVATHIAFADDAS